MNAHFWGLMFKYQIAFLGFFTATYTVGWSILVVLKLSVNGFVWPETLRITGDAALILLIVSLLAAKKLSKKLYALNEPQNTNPDTSPRP